MVWTLINDIYNKKLVLIFKIISSQNQVSSADWWGMGWGGVKVPYKVTS